MGRGCWSPILQHHCRQSQLLGAKPGQRDLSIISVPGGCPGSVGLGGDCWGCAGTGGVCALKSIPVPSLTSTLSPSITPEFNQKQPWHCSPSSSQPGALESSLGFLAPLGFICANLPLGAKVRGKKRGCKVPFAVPRMFKWAQSI